MKPKKTNPRKQPLTKYEVNKLINSAMEQAARELSLMAICAACMSLHDAFNFGPQRLDKFVSNVMQKFNDWDADLYTADDAKEWLEEYSGIKIEELNNRLFEHEKYRGLEG